MTSNKNTLPKIIWTGWHQGLSGAPYVVQKCVQSWIDQNPDWELIFLSKTNLEKYAKLDLPADKLAQLSLVNLYDLARLKVLYEHGGVWVDSTTFCAQPLDQWIDAKSKSGFFAFDKPGPDRMLSSWFLAAVKNNVLIQETYDHLIDFWKSNDFLLPSAQFTKTVQLLSKMLNKDEHTALLWLSPTVTKLFKVHPYFICHYMFKHVVTQRDECANIWNNTPKVSADGPHSIQFAGMLSPLSKEIKHEIDRNIQMVYKLTWKFDKEKFKPSTTLYYLLEDQNKHSEY